MFDGIANKSAEIRAFLLASLLYKFSNKFLHLRDIQYFHNTCICICICTTENLESFSNRRFMVCRRTWRQSLHSHRRRCAVFSRGSSDLSPPALRTLRGPSAAAITKADNTGHRLRHRHSKYFQNVAVFNGDQGPCLKY